MTAGSIDSLTHKKRYSPLFLLVFCTFCLLSLIALGAVFMNIAIGVPYDWVAYWASAHELVHHLNPYDSIVVRALEIAHGYPVTQHVLSTRNPPNALFLMVLLGYFPAYAAALLWRAIILACLLSCIRLLMHDANTSMRTYGLALCFTPAYFTFMSGQASIFALLGFLLFVKLHRLHPFFGGAALSLCAIKPHLFLPLAVVILVWIVTRRAYRVVWGALTAIFMEAAFPLYFDHAVWSHYLLNIRADGIQTQFLPTIAVELRFLIGNETTWIVFVPAVVASIWAGWYFRRHRDDWDWDEHGPILLLVSLLVTPYAWIFDGVLALPAILRAAERCSNTMLAVLMTIMAVGTLQFFFLKVVNAPSLIWQVPAWLLWYVLAIRFPLGDTQASCQRLSQGIQYERSR